MFGPASGEVMASNLAALVTVTEPEVAQALGAVRNRAAQALSAKACRISHAGGGLRVRRVLRGLRLLGWVRGTS